MAETYHFTTEAVGQLDAPFLCIRNIDFANPTRTFTLRNVSVVTPIITLVDPAASYQTPINLLKISAYTGGDEGAFYGARSDSSLPSQVKIVTNPEVVTSSAVVCARAATNYTFGAGSLTAASAVQLPANNVFKYFDWAKEKGAGETIKLQEGQGLYIGSSLKDNTARINFSGVIWEVVVSDGTNQYYSLVEAGLLIGGLGSLVIWNGSGSGVVLSVISINRMQPYVDCLAVGTATAIDPHNDWGMSTGVMGACCTQYRVERGYSNLNGGRTVAVVGSRTNATALAGKLQVVASKFSDPIAVSYSTQPPNIKEYLKGTVASAANQGWETFFRTALFTQIKRKWWLITPTTTGLLVPPAKAHAFAPGQKNGMQPITLAPGDMFVISPTGNPSAPNVFITGEIVYTDATGEVYPAVGDVDHGVQYGPTGTDYTGTLEQPAVGDVKSGVTYGAGGTEFTGTYAGGGGGGNTYSRGRVVNS